MLTASRPTNHTKLIAWVDEMRALCQPDAVVWCDGSQAEYDRLCDQMVSAGTLIRLNPEKRPNSYLCRSDPRDVARVEDRTFICITAQERCRPHQQLDEPEGDEGHRSSELFDGCMRGRTMYVIPFSMGPLGSADRAASACSSPTRPTSSSTCGS